MDGVAVSLQPTEETKGGYANGQADQRNHNAHPCDDRQQKFIDAALILKRKKEEACCVYVCDSLSP